MRDNYCNQKELESNIDLYTSFIAEDIEDIKMLEEDILNGVKRYPAENEDIIVSTNKGIVSKFRTVLDSKYSLGLPCETIIDQYIQAIPFYTQVNLDMGYINIINFISKGFLLGIPKQELKGFVNKLDDLNFNDCLFDFIVSGYGINRSFSSTGFDWGKPYDYLYSIIEVAQNDKIEASRMLEEYTEKRYINGHANCGWKTFHKEAGYVGLWSYEAGAVSKLLGLDDSKLINSIHYPYDLVHFREDTSFDAIDVGAAIDVGENKTAINEYSISNCQELDLIIPNEFREYVDQAISDYNSLSDEVFLEKYDLHDIWFSLEEYKQDKAKGILGFIIVNLLVNKNYIYQLDWKEDPADYLDDLNSCWNCEEKIVEFDLDNDQLYLARVPKESEFSNIYEVKIRDFTGQ